MKAIKRPAGAIFLLVVALASNAIAQQKPKTPSKSLARIDATRAPAPTFDTLVPADTYTFYGEIRGVGSLIRSSSVNDLLEPVLKLSGPMDDFRFVVKWLNTHADEVMTSRLLLAAWPNNRAKNAPELIVAIEFETPEQATKFAVTLKTFLPKIVPAAVPDPSPESGPPPNPAERQKPSDPNFHLKRYGSLLVITPKSWTSTQLKPAGSKNLADDVNFRAAHTRFNSEPVFVYFDSKALARDEEDQRKRWEQEKIEAQKKAEAEAESKKEEKEAEPDTKQVEDFTVTEEVRNVSLPPAGEVTAAPEKPDPFSKTLFFLSSLLFAESDTHWPDGVGFALSYEGDSFDLRALLISEAGQKINALPFLPMLFTGSSFTPEASNIFPADTELLLSLSLDLQQMYAQMVKPRPEPNFINQNSVTEDQESEQKSLFAQLEKESKINIKDDLLPLLGPEIAVMMPLQNMGMFGLSSLVAPTESNGEQKKNATVLAIAIRDREAMKALMPKIIDAFGAKGASAFAQTERREDIEIISFAGRFSYAFVENFILFSDAASVRHVVDSYLKHETLATENQFRSSTRWQPRPLHGHVYISPALMEGYRMWAQTPNTLLGEQTRAFILRDSVVAQPLTYSVWNEGLGPLHELHIPKNLVLMAVAGISGESNPPPAVRNQRIAIGLMYSIAYAETNYQRVKGNGSYGTLDQLFEEKLVMKEPLESSGYKFELTINGDTFELSAVPLEYGVTGKLSFYIDKKSDLRGADRNGAPATSSDPPIRY